MAEFGGYEMPLWYRSAKKEHLAVLTAAGLFDTSHMAVVMASGPQVRELLQRCFTKDLESCVGRQRQPLSVGRCVYGAFLHEDGCVLDDSIIYQHTPENYMIVVNAGMGALVTRHLEDRRAQREATLVDLTDQFGKIDLQGPAAPSIMRRVLADPDQALRKLPYFGFKGHFHESPSDAAPVMLENHVPLLLSRTGYTGEVGFELFCALDRACGLWETLLQAGQDMGLIACGLAARDSLRGGACLPLSHQDIGSWSFINHPWPFALPFDENGKTFTKDFVGAHALLHAEDAPHTYIYVGHDARKVFPEENAEVIDSQGRSCGKVLSCVSDMGIDRHKDRIYSVASPDKPQDFTPRGLCCGFVRVHSPLQTGQMLELKDRRRSIKVTVVNDVRPARTARMPLKVFL